jgi:hypothetical protein
MVEHDDGRIATAACALDRTQRDLAILARLAGLDPELLRERVHDLLRPDERARHVRADLDHVLADGRQVVHVVEGRDRLHVRRRQVERFGDLDERLRREPAAVLVLGEP